MANEKMKFPTLLQGMRGRTFEVKLYTNDGVLTQSGQITGIEQASSHLIRVRYADTAGESETILGNYQLAELLMNGRTESGVMSYSVK